MADNRCQLVLTRRLPARPQEVWRALTEPELLHAWFPNEVHGAHRAGAPLRFTFAGRGDTGAFDGQMRTWDPPRTLAFRWGEDDLRFDLEPDDDATVLTLVDTLADVERAGRDAAGWQVCLDRLGRHLGDAPAERPGSGEHGRDPGRDEPVATELVDLSRDEPTPWHAARRVLVETSTYWLATTGSEGHPRLTPCPGVWQEGQLYVSAGESSRIAADLARDPRCAVAASSDFPALHVVGESAVWRVTGQAALRWVARAYEAKYEVSVAVQGEALHGDNSLSGEPAPYAVFGMAPSTILGFPPDAGTPGSQGSAGEGRVGPTRWHFSPSPAG